MLIKFNILNLIDMVKSLVNKVSGFLNKKHESCGDMSILEVVGSFLLLSMILGFMYVGIWFCYIIGL